MSRGEGKVPAPKVEREKVMKNEIVKIKVAFKVLRGEVIAHFKAVYNEETAKWEKDNRTTYAHMGQHSECDPWYMASLKSAKPADYAPLLRELHAIGYAVTNVTRDRNRAAA